jgi:outer membrane protein assembly factor BamB
VGDADRQFIVKQDGSSLTVAKRITPADKREADTIWVFDMMTELGIWQHNMCSCSVTALGDVLFVNTSNGVNETHIELPAPDAPSFIAMDKSTGKVLWTDKSPGVNILHGQWSSPAVGKLGGVSQVIFSGGDGWVYSFQADGGKGGKPTLLWKFDANPKDSKWLNGGRGTRNNIIATPVICDGLVYVTVGQDPENGEGEGHLWCLDPTKRGDVSSQLAVKEDARDTIIEPRRMQAVIAEQGEVAIDNPNSSVVWHYTRYDQNGDGEYDFEEEMHRSCGTVAIKNDLLFIADFSGLFHCLDAKTGKVHWTYDMFAAAWSSALIVENHVYIGDEDGDVAVFDLTTKAHEPIAEINMGNSVYSAPIVANNVLFIASKTHLFAIKAADSSEE